MLRKLGYGVGTIGFAVGSAFVIFLVWNQLIRAEVVANATLEWYPTVAFVWFFLFCGVGWLVRPKQTGTPPQQPSNH